MQNTYQLFSFLLVLAITMPPQALAANESKTEQGEAVILLEDFYLSTQRDRKYSTWIERNIKTQERGAWRQVFGKLLNDQWPRFIISKNNLLIFSEKDRQAPEIMSLAKDSSGAYRLIYNARDITRREKESLSAWLARVFPQAVASPKVRKTKSAQALLDLLIPEAEAGFFVPLVAGLVGGGVGSFVGSRSGTRAGIAAAARDGYLSGGGPGANYYSAIISQAGFSSGEVEGLRAELGESLGRLQSSTNGVAQEVRNLRQYLETDFQAFFREAIKMMPGYEAEVRRKLLDALRRKVAREVYEGFGLTCPVSDKGGIAAFRIDLNGQILDVNSRVDDAGRLEMDFRDPANDQRRGSYLFSFDSNAMRASHRTERGSESSTSNSEVALAPFLRPDTPTYLDTLRSETLAAVDPRTKGLIDDALIGAAFCENYDSRKLLSYLLDREPAISAEELAEFNASAPLVKLRSCVDERSNTSRAQFLRQQLREFADSPPNPNCLEPMISLDCAGFLQSATNCLGPIVSANMGTAESTLLPSQKEATRAIVAGWGPSKRGEVLRRLYSAPFSEVKRCEANLLSTVRLRNPTDEKTNILRYNSFYNQWQRDLGRLSDLANALPVSDSRTEEVFKLAESAATCCSDEKCRRSVATNTEIRGTEAEPTRIRSAQ